MNIQYYLSRGLTTALFPIAILLSSESLAGLVVDSIDSRLSMIGRLTYDSTEDDTVRGRIDYQFSDSDERHSVDLSTQSVDLAVYEEVNNFADAPLSDRYSFVSSGSATASYTNSAELSLFHSLIELDYGPLKAPDNPNYDEPDASHYGMFSLGSLSNAAIRFNFSIDTPHEYTLFYAFESDKKKNNNAQPLVRLFESDQNGIIYENNGHFFSGERKNSISGFLEPGNYFILNDMIEQQSMEFGSPLDFGTPTTSHVALSLKDLDENGSQNIPAPTTILLLLTGIGLLRLRHH